MNIPNRQLHQKHLLCGRKLGPGPYCGSFVISPSFFSAPSFLSVSEPLEASVGNSSWKFGDLCPTILFTGSPIVTLLQDLAAPGVPALLVAVAPGVTGVDADDAVVVCVGV